MQYVLFFLIFIMVSAAGYYLRKYRREVLNAQSLAERLMTLDHEMHDTIAMGLHARFRIDDENEEKENPFDFEYFVSRIMSDYYGGTTYVTPPISDYGVDIEDEREDGLYLGQVKCYAPGKNFVNFEAIAIIHSQMVKQGAKGGYVVTTSEFTPNARKYAAEVGVELIEGKDLVRLWALAIEKNRTPAIIPQDIEYGTT
jgi:restriction system protein